VIGIESPVPDQDGDWVGFAEGVGLEDPELFGYACGLSVRGDLARVALSEGGLVVSPPGHRTGFYGGRTTPRERDVLEARRERPREDEEESQGHGGEGSPIGPAKRPEEGAWELGGNGR